MCSSQNTLLITLAPIALTKFEKMILMMLLATEIFLAQVRREVILRYLVGFRRTLVSSPLEDSNEAFSHLQQLFTEIYKKIEGKSLAKFSVTKF